MDSVQPIQQTPKLRNSGHGDFKFSIKNILLVIATVVVLIVIWTWISSPMLISVTGAGEASVAPTNATLSFTLSSNDVNAAAAIATVNSRVESLKQLVKNTGVSEEDIVETQVNVVPAATVALGSTGYQASVSMAVKTSHVNSVPTLISTLYDNGAVLVSQPTLGVDDSEVLEQKAFDEAMKDAKSKAGKIALKNWKLFRKIVAINQQTSGTTSTATSKADVLTEAQNEFAVSNGIFKINKAVSVTYKMW